MQTEVYHSNNPPFTWIDVHSPEPEELRRLAHRYGLHATSVDDCLDPDHLPKHERIGETTFLIFRVYDTEAGPRSAKCATQGRTQLGRYRRWNWENSRRTRAD